jgi:hypothetical protein
MLVSMTSTFSPKLAPFSEAEKLKMPDFFASFMKQSSARTFDKID